MTKSPWILTLTALALAGCASRAPAAAVSQSAPRVESLRRQLAGHLERAQGCFTEARMRDPEASGLVRFGFDIQSDGQVESVDVEAWSEDEELLAACVRSRLVNLYFDPAPPREVRIDRTFYFCPDERGGLCQLGPARPLGMEASRELLDRVDDGLAERDGALEACAARIGGGPAVFDVRLELGPDGRVMAGQLMDSHPADTALARCAVGPLLGARVEGESPGERVQLRYVYRLGGGEPQGRSGARQASLQR